MRSVLRLLMTDLTDLSAVCAEDTVCLCPLQDGCGSLSKSQHLPCLSHRTNTFHVIPAEPTPPLSFPYNQHLPCLSHTTNTFPVFPIKPTPSLSFPLNQHLPCLYYRINTFPVFPIEPTPSLSVRCSLAVSCSARLSGRDLVSSLSSLCELYC